MPENVCFAEVQKMSLIWHILDVFELLSVPIEPIPFPFYQESSDTSVDYPHHNFLRRLKIHFFRPRPPLRGHLGTFFGIKKYILDVLGL